MEANIMDLAVRGDWIALAAIVIAVIVRLLKSDTDLVPLVVPARARPWLAIGLGLMAGVVERVAHGTPWKPAIVGGLIAGMLPILGHELVIESLRGGKEIKVEPPAGPTPPHAGVLPIALASALAMVTACAGSFEEAKIAGKPATLAATPARSTPLDARCRDLDSARMHWSAIAKAAGAVSGASGIAAIPVDPEARPYVIGGGVSALVVGAYALVLSEGYSETWARECAS